MKNIYIYLSLLAVIVLGTACNNEWEDEQYEQYVSFKAPIAAGGDGVTTIYVRYKDNGKVTYQLPVIVKWVYGEYTGQRYSYSSGCGYAKNVEHRAF